MCFKCVSITIATAVQFQLFEPRLFSTPLFAVEFHEWYSILYISSSCLLFIISIWMESFCSLSVHNNKSLTHSTYYRLCVRANYVRMVGILFGYCYRYGARTCRGFFFFCQFIVAFLINRIVSISND